MKRMLAAAMLAIAFGTLTAAPVSAVDIDECINTGIFLSSTEAVCKQLAETTPLDPERCERAKTAFLQCTQAMSFMECGSKGIYASRCEVSAGTASTPSCVEGPSGQGCCIETTSEDKLPKYDDKCKTEKEACATKAGVTLYSCCLCKKDTTGKMVSASRETYDSCKKKCEAEGMSIESSFGAGNLPRSATAAAPSASALADVNALCFTRAECAKPEYGGSVEAFRPGYGCPSGKGRCIAPEPQVKLSIPLGGITTVQGIRGYIASAFQYGISIVAILAGVMFVYGGFRYIFGSAFGDIRQGREIMVDAGVGLLLVLGAYTILAAVNPATLELKKLEVFMINKEVFIQAKWCTDLKTIMGDDGVTFAEAGEAPDYKSPDGLSFTIAADDTRCGAEYYAEGLGANRCNGRSCAHLDEGMACIKCSGSEGDMPECAGKTGYTCAKAGFAGTVTFKDSRRIEELVMFLICNDAVGKEEENIASGVALNNIHKFKDSGIQSAEGQTGTQGYAMGLTPAEIQKAESECKNESGVKGFVLAFQYNDPGSSLVSFASETVAEATVKDEFAVAGPGNCGNASRFPGYVESGAATGDATLSASTDEFDMEVAILCGISSQKQTYWTLDQMKAAAGMGESAKAILCDLHLDSGNAPLDVTSGSSYAEIGSRFKCGN